MKVNELRIGNVVLEETMSYAGLKVKQITVAIRDLSNHDNLRPIPLTEDWLIKFGFKKQTTMYYRKGNYEFELEKGFIDDGMAVINTYNPIRYVHSLQNLYYTITGDELVSDNKTIAQ